MHISKDNSVKVIYKLYDAKNNILLEEVPEGKAITLKLGIGHVFPDFEKNLIGLSAGDTFDFIITAENAYGAVDTYAIFDIPKETFEIDGKLPDDFFLPGKKVAMHDNNGVQHIGKMIKIMDDAVTIDFNHPYAGIDLRYMGKVIEVF
jgi:FKBP-type peptidyl-prolyl cis-trans isomerase SlyD